MPSLWVADYLLAEFSTLACEKCAIQRSPKLVASREGPKKILCRLTPRRTTAPIAGIVHSRRNRRVLRRRRGW